MIKLKIIFHKFIILLTLNILPLSVRTCVVMLTSVLTLHIWCTLQELGQLQFPGIPGFPGSPLHPFTTSPIGPGDPFLGYPGSPFIPGGPLGPVFPLEPSSPLQQICVFVQFDGGGQG